MHLPKALATDVLAQFALAGVEAISIEFNPDACILRLALPAGCQKEPLEAHHNTKAWQAMTEAQQADLRAAYLARWKKISSAYAKVMRTHFPDAPPPAVTKVYTRYVVQVTLRPPLATPMQSPCNQPTTP